MRQILLASGASLLLAAVAVVACVGDDPSLTGANADGGSGGDAAGSEGGTTKDDGSTLPPTDGGAACDGPCAPEDLFVDAPDNIARIAVDEINVYFATRGNTDTKVYACPKTGCAGSPIVLGDSYAVNIVALNGTIYWGDGSGAIRQSPRSGGMTTTFATDAGSLAGVWTEGTRLYFDVAGTTESCTPTSCTPSNIHGGSGIRDQLAVSSSNLAWIDDQAQKVYACALPACEPVVSLGDGQEGLSITGNVVIWSGNSQVHACGVGGCANAPTTVADLTSGGVPTFTATDGAQVYFREFATKSLMRCPIAGCPGVPEKLETDPLLGGEGSNLVLDGPYLYWAAANKLRRMRVK